MHKFLTKQLEDKTIVWFNATNNYIILEEIAAQLVQQILEKKSLQEIATGLTEHLKISSQEALKLIYDLNDQIVTPNTTIKN